MRGLESWFGNSVASKSHRRPRSFPDSSSAPILSPSGGLFVEPIVTSSLSLFIRPQKISSPCGSISASCFRRKKGRVCLSSVSLSVKEGREGFISNCSEVLGQNGEKSLEEEEGEKMGFGEVEKSWALNVTKHLLSGAAATVVSRRKIENINQQDEEKSSALEQSELGPISALIYGAIGGICSELTSHPVFWHQLQMKVKETKATAMTTSAKLVMQGDIPALYMRLTPIFLQVLPLAAINYLVHELTKIILKVE